MIFSISVSGQFMIVEHGGAAFQTVPLDQHLWMTSILIGLVSIPIGAIIRMIPDELVSLQKKRKENKREEALELYEHNNEKVILQIDPEEHTSIHWPIKIT